MVDRRSAGSEPSMSRCAVLVVALLVIRAAGKAGRTRAPAGPEFNHTLLAPPLSGISPTDYAENFRKFLDDRPKDKPFCFWYGGHEPHRKYEQGSGVKSGKKLSDVTLPPY